ncbi:VG15 protein [Corynebacterium cystitidis]|uniref:VG15 protein n=1 Tax=Corynebacterium cystitidis TaxID=35757 RepID=UPI00211EE811|nr:toxin glutamine deamidase domain-containing protein [Corynebacterium cystitidis]
MSLADIEKLDREIDRVAGQVVADAIGQNGIPRNKIEAYELAQVLYPEIKRLRQRAKVAYLNEIGESMAAAGLRARPGRLRDYPLSAVIALIERAAGLTGSDNTVEVQILDPKTRESESQRIAPYKVHYPTPEITQVVAARITASVARHALSAGRSMVANTAARGEVYDRKGSKRRVGYARVLSGKESCSFCAMLASRGPVYKEDTVTRRRDGRKYHDNCDCIPVMVVDGLPWEGQAEAEALYDEWLKYTNYQGSTPQQQSEAWAKAVNSGKVDLRLFSPFTPERGASPPSITGVSRKGSKRIMKSAVSKANPTGDMENCVRSVNAWAMRRLGYDVQAVPGQPGMGAEESTRTWRDKRGQTPRWIKPEASGRAPKWNDAVEMFSQQPNGSWGFLSYKPPKAYPHVVAWEIQEDTLEYYDPQRPSSNVDNDLENAVAGSFKWVNLDGFSPSAGSVEIVEGSGRESR